MEEHDSLRHKAIAGAEGRLIFSELIGKGACKDQSAAERLSGCVLPVVRAVHRRFSRSLRSRIRFCDRYYRG